MIGAVRPRTRVVLLTAANVAAKSAIRIAAPVCALGLAIAVAPIFVPAMLLLRWLELDQSDEGRYGDGGIE